MGGKMTILATILGGFHDLKRTRTQRIKLELAKALAYVGPR